ncbi:methyl-accepting chemotaxis protein [Pseudophaeobacter leonis]|uniref:methyl-accepting chemotaxis protein n=1 Tax=Pseudophaeobacter leonis TaxID=1144477 RepID=UPI001F4D4208|nr:methyl-accepting chemotaxis protein [Pseudophaeobacter leonis]
MTFSVMQERIDSLVLSSLLSPSEVSTEQKTEQETKLKADGKTLRAALTAIQTFEQTLSQSSGQPPEQIPDLSEVLSAALPLADAFILSSQAMQTQARADRAAAMSALPAYQEKSRALKDMLAPLRGGLESLAEAATRRADLQNTTLLYLLLAISGTFTGLVLHHARKSTLTIIRPIERLRDALKEVSDGNFDLKVSNRMRADDFGKIAHDIDLISQRVVKTLAEQNALRAEGERVISRLGAGLKKLSTGDLSDQIMESFNEEYEALSVDFNETVNQLNILISKVVQASTSIQARSEEIHNASQDLSLRTSSQATTLEETAEALEHMTNSVNTAAQNTKDVEAAVVTARKEVEHSGRVVEGAIAAMNEIETSSSRISQIIGVIDDIAFQTNLLALNAGVEAARAGEVGRGFAVVASEVRDLAQRSSDAAKEIKILISTSSQHVQDGVHQVDGAGKALEAVVRQVAHISDLVSGISTVSAEQANDINEVNNGVAQLDQVTQKNATMVTESSTAIQSLNRETLGLNQLVGQFVLRTDDGADVAEAEFEPESQAEFAAEAELQSSDLFAEDEEPLPRSA